MDNADIARDNAQRANDDAVAARVRYHGESATECQECGDPIPERRRQSIAGTQHCASCTDWLQRRGLLSA